MMWFSPKFYGSVFFISVFILTFKVVSLRYNLLMKSKCCFRHRGTDLPLDNQYGCYRTKTRRQTCIIKRSAAISSIQTIGDPQEGELKLFYSPNFILDEDYKPNRAYIYNVACDDGFLAHLNLSSLDLNPNSYEDFLEVHHRSSSNQPVVYYYTAGSVTADISYVLFRSGKNDKNNNKMSFQAYLVCLKSSQLTAGCPASHQDRMTKRQVPSSHDPEYYAPQGNDSFHEIYAPQGNDSINTDALIKAAFDVIIKGINFTDEDLNRARLYQNTCNPVLRTIARAILNCTNSYCGTRRIMLTVNTTKDCDALHGSEYELMCTMRPITGMTLPPLMEWVGPDGNVLVSGGNVKISEVETRGIVSTFSLSFHPVLSSQGGRYTCRATVNIPWMKEQPDQLNATFHMPVTTQAMFQLKLYPLPHCVTWDLEKAHDVETSIKRELEKAVRERCECDFSSTAINSGVFSCQTATCQSNCLPITHVIYRAIINGTSDFPTADQLIDHMKEWQKSSSSLLYNVFHLNLASNDECQLRIGSLYEKEC